MWSNLNISIESTWSKSCEKNKGLPKLPSRNKNRINFVISRFRVLLSEISKLKQVFKVSLSLFLLISLSAGFTWFLPQGKYVSWDLKNLFIMKKKLWFHLIKAQPNLLPLVRGYKHKLNFYVRNPQVATEKRGQYSQAICLFHFLKPFRT